MSQSETRHYKTTSCSISSFLFSPACCSVAGKVTEEERYGGGWGRVGWGGVGGNENTHSMSSTSPESERHASSVGRRVVVASRVPNIQKAQSKKGLLEPWTQFCACMCVRRAVPTPQLCGWMVTLRGTGRCGGRGGGYARTRTRQRPRHSLPSSCSAVPVTHLPSTQVHVSEQDVGQGRGPATAAVELQGVGATRVLPAQCLPPHTVRTLHTKRVQRCACERCVGLG